LAILYTKYQSVIEPMLRRLPYLKLVGVVRHPCAVLNSWKKMRSNPLLNLISCKIFILRYEDAIDDPAALFEKLFYFIGFSLKN